MDVEQGLPSAYVAATLPMSNTRVSDTETKIPQLETQFPLTESAGSTGRDGPLRSLVTLWFRSLT
jgi:hypothetical protein